VRLGGKPEDGRGRAGERVRQVRFAASAFIPSPATLAAHYSHAVSARSRSMHTL
jgi:hypothetical protein